MIEFRADQSAINHRFNDINYQSIDGRRLWRCWLSVGLG